MYDVTALGEILIDFTPAGKSMQENALFEKNPGGAPANVLACVSRLGGSAAFIGKVGDDIFGHFLAEVLKDYEIDISGIRYDSDCNTTLAFVELSDAGERSFSFYRKPGADTRIQAAEIDYSLIKNSRIFHFGSLSLTDEPARSATLAAIEHAKENNCIISYDPNLRPPLWRSLSDAKKQICSVLAYADIIKVAEEELEFITDIKDLNDATYKLYKDYNIEVILVSRGSKGAFYRLKEKTGFVAAVKGVKVVDTTGAGDAFLGGFLFAMCNNNITNINEINSENIERFIGFGNAAAAVCIKGRGAIPSMPELQQVNELLK